MKLELLSIVILLLLVYPANANIIANETYPFVIITQSGYINITSNQSFDMLSTSQSTPNSVNFTINSTTVNFTSTSSTNLSNISYVNDNITFDAEMSSGILYIDSKMLRSSTFYRLFVDTIAVYANLPSSSIGIVSFTYASLSKNSFLLSYVLEDNPIQDIENESGEFDIINWIISNVNRGTFGLGFPLAALMLIGMVYLCTRKAGIAVGVMNVLFAAMIYFGLVTQEISSVMIIFAVVATASIVFSMWFKNKL